MSLEVRIFLDPISQVSGSIGTIVLAPLIEPVLDLKILYFYFRSSIRLEFVLYYITSSA